MLLWRPIANAEEIERNAMPKPRIFAIAAFAVLMPQMAGAQSYAFPSGYSNGYIFYPGPLGGRDYGYGPQGPLYSGSNYGHGPFGPLGFYDGSYGYRFRFGSARGKEQLAFERRAFKGALKAPEFSRRYYGTFASDPAGFESERAKDRAGAKWREPYPHDYVFADDPFYAQCRKDPAVGDAVHGTVALGFNDEETSTAAMIFARRAGESLARELNCEDRLIVYRLAHDAFDGERPFAEYPWANPVTGRSGSLHIGKYYRDRDGFACADYSHTMFANGRRLDMHGIACRQQDGTWTAFG
jgi:surface antigen